MAKVFFENIKEQITSNISTANYSIKLALAWFTDADLFQILIQKALKGVKIELIINNDDINNEGKNKFETLYQYGGRVFYPNEDDILMHNKFCIIDNKIVLSGSYNWTNKANYNDENLIVIDDQNMVCDFDTEFIKLREKCVGIEHFLNLEIKHEINLSDVNELIKRAESRAEIGNYQAAIKDYEAIISINSDKEYLFQIAFCYYQLDNSNAAINYYSKYLEYNSSCFLTYNFRGLLYIDNGEIQKALLDFDKAIELKPYDDFAYSNKAYAKAKEILNFEGSILAETNKDNQYRLVQKEDVENISLEWEGASSRFSKIEKNAIEAIALYKKSFEIAGKENLADLKHIGDLYWKLLDYKNAEKFYTKCLGYGKEDYLLYDRGYTFYCQKNYKNALKDFEEAKSISPHKSHYSDAIAMVKKNMKTKWFW